MQLPGSSDKLLCLHYWLTSLVKPRVNVGFWLRSSLFVVVDIPLLVVAVAANSQNKKFKGTDAHICQQGVCMSDSDTVISAGWECPNWTLEFIVKKVLIWYMLSEMLPYSSQIDVNSEWDSWRNKQNGISYMYINPHNLLYTDSNSKSNHCFLNFQILQHLSPRIHLLLVQKDKLQKLWQNQTCDINWSTCTRPVLFCIWLWATPKFSCRQSEGGEGS